MSQRLTAKPSSRAVTTPSDEQFYNKLSPELKKKVDAQRDATRRKAAYAEQIAVSGGRCGAWAA